MAGGLIAVDDPRKDDVRALLERHLAFALETTPPEHAFALDVDGLIDPAVTFYSLRANGALLGIGAIKQLDVRHGEIKSMHTARAARGRGVGRAMLGHLLGVARSRGFRPVRCRDRDRRRGSVTGVAEAPSRPDAPPPVAHPVGGSCW